MTKGDKVGISETIEAEVLHTLPGADSELSGVLPVKKVLAETKRRVRRQCHCGQDFVDNWRRNRLELERSYKTVRKGPPKDIEDKIKLIVDDWRGYVKKYHGIEL